MAASGGVVVIFATCYLLSSCVIRVSCWDSDDLELFDLVEEVNANFYEVLEVDKNAATGEIRRAYRKQSLILHPDKNKAEDAEEKFRQLVAIYDVLKDSEKRERYNAVLENGLPDWRQPVYYYRRVRKMGVLELAVLLAVIITIGQYLVLWSIYLERRFTLEENFRAKKKSDRKKKKAKFNDEIEEVLQECIELMPKPKLLDLWPVTFTKWTVRTTISMPTYIRDAREQRRERLEQLRFEKEEMEREKELEKEYEVKRVKRKVKPDGVEGAPVVYGEGAPVVYGQEGAEEETEEGEEGDGQDRVKSGEWTDEDYVLLSKAYIKFPGGTVDRWDKIAEMVQRPVAEVTIKCKQMKGTYQMNLSSTVQGGVQKTSKKGVEISDNIISHTEADLVDALTGADSEDSDSKIRKRQKPKPSKDKDRTLMLAKEPVKPVAQSEIQNNTEKQTGPVTNSGVKNRKPMSAAQSAGAQNETEKVQNKSAISLNKDQSGTDSDVWSQNQQVILEWALRQYPKTTDQRWEKIAEHIPGKTKEDCIARFKHLAEVVKQRKQQQS